MSTHPALGAKHIEDLETLSGARGRGDELVAVRLRDLKPLLELPASLQSLPSAAAPTKVEFDLLQADLARIHLVLLGVSKVLGGLVRR